MAQPSFTIGIEEEYLLIDRVSRDLVSDPPPAMLADCERRLAGQVSPEFLRSQIEVQTRPCRTAATARAELAHLRRSVAEIAAGHDLAIIAAASHPFATWGAQKATERARYVQLERDLRGVGRRLVICGLHVHVGIDDDELRIDLMNQIAYFLPHLLALSTSSPFWEGQDTGLKSYRLAVFDELPRTGLPEYFDSYGEYQRHVQVMVRAGLIEDATKLWWDVRPSARFPTLEMRITDMCTRLDDAAAIAALYQCLLAALYRLRRGNQRWRIYAHMLVDENRWRAQRDGFDSGLVDFGKGQVMPYAELLEELIALARPEAEQLGCVAEIEATRAILTRGTSAHRQLGVHRDALARGLRPQAALEAVVDWLAGETLAGL